MFSPICKDFKLNLCNNKQMESCGQCALHLLSRTWQESRSREITQSFFSRAGELNFDATFSFQFSRFRERENSLSPLASWDFFLDWHYLSRGILSQIYDHCSELLRQKFSYIWKVRLVQIGAVKLIKKPKSRKNCRTILYWGSQAP